MRVTFRVILHHTSYPLRSPTASYYHHAVFFMKAPILFLLLLLLSFLACGQEVVALHPPQDDAQNWLGMPYQHRYTDMFWTTSCVLPQPFASTYWWIAYAHEILCQRNFVY